MESLRRLVHEIHRRSLWQILAVYAAGAWVALQVAETLTESVGLPGWFPGFALGLLIVGLPVVLATAFVQEGGAEGADDAPGPAAAAPEPAGELEESRISRLLTWRNAIAGGVLAFALWGLVAAGWMLAGSGGPAEPPEESTPSIAVLPFLNVSEEEESDYFSDGVTEEIITALSQIRGLQVVSRSATFRYKDSDVDPREVGRELGVSTILEGSVRRAGERVRITAQLIDVEDGFHLWSESYDRGTSDIFEIQQDVAERIAGALRLNFTESDRRSIRRRATDDIRAYDYYSRARHEFYRYTPEGNAAAIELFREALEIDPDYALALAGLSLCQTQYINRGWSDDLEWLDRAEETARRALEIDRELAEAHFALGFVYERRGMFDAEEKEMRAVLARNPNHAHAHDSMGDVYMGRGLLEKALEEFAIALRLDPFLVPALYNSGRSLTLLGRFREALERFRRGVEVNPGIDWFHVGIANVMRERGEHAAAVEAYEEALSVEPRSRRAHVGLVGARIAAGDREGARAAAEALAELAEMGPRFAAAHRSALGELALAEGEAERAVALFREALDLEGREGVIVGGGGVPFRPPRAGLARALVVSGRPEAAVGEYERAIAEDPALKVLRFELARALEEAGETDRAREAYRAFLESWAGADPDAPLVDRARRRYAALLEG